MIEIKPCPFCGRTNIGVGPGDSFRWMLAYCRECGAQSGEVRVQTLGAGTPEEWNAAGRKAAIEEWNTRATPSEERKP